MPEPAATRLARDLSMLATLTRRVLEGGVRRGDDEVTFTQVVVLKWLCHAKPRRARDVAKFLAASAPAASQILARLQRKGLIAIRRSRTDARVGELTVTARGRALVAAHERERERTMDRALSGLSAAELERVATALEAAIEVLVRTGAQTDDLCLHCDALQAPHCVMRGLGHRCPAQG